MNFRNALTITAVSALLLGGCSASSATPVATAESDATAQPNVLRVGMECNYAPYNWSTTTKTHTAQPISSVDYCDGFDVEMAGRLAEALDMDVQIVKLDWDSLVISLNNNQIDAIIAGMTDTEERREQVNFTTPYYVSTEVILVRKDSELANITSIDELSGHKVQGQMNTLYDTIIDQIPDVNHMPAAETFPAAIQALLAGGVEAVTSELPVAKGVVEANPDLTFITFEDGKGFTGAEQDASVSIAVRKNDTELQAALQRALDDISLDEREAMMLDAVNRQPASNE